MKRNDIKSSKLREAMISLNPELQKKLTQVFVVPPNVLDILPKEDNARFIALYSEAVEAISPTIANFSTVLFPNLAAEIANSKLFSDPESLDFTSSNKLSALPVDLLISYDDGSDFRTAKECYELIIKKENSIIELLNAKLNLLQSSNDNLRELLEEAIDVLQDGKYLAAQSMFKDIADMIITMRFEPGYKAGYLRNEYKKDKHFPVLSDNNTKPMTEEDYYLYREWLAKEYACSPYEISILNMLVVVYLKTDVLVKQGYDMRYTPNRNGSAHVGNKYYSPFNALAFGLIVCKLITFCYSNSTTKLKVVEEWDNDAG